MKMMENAKKSLSPRSQKGKKYQKWVPKMKKIEKVTKVGPKNGNEEIV